VATESIKWIKDLRGLIEKIGMAKIEAVIAAGDQAKASKLIREAMFSS
jgi:hypothetical protein